MNELIECLFYLRMVEQAEDLESLDLSYQKDEYIRDTVKDRLVEKRRRVLSYMLQPESDPYFALLDDAMDRLKYRIELVEKLAIVDVAIKNVKIQLREAV